MQAEEWVESLIAAVRRRVTPKKLGIAEELAGVGVGYLRKAQSQAQNIMLAKFLRVCVNAGIDPAEVFAEIFPVSEPALDFGVEIPQRPAPHIVKRVRQRLEQGETVAQPLPRSWLEWLDELRYDKPKLALSLTEDTIDFVREGDLPFALGIWGSTCRLFSRYDEGFLAILEGIELTKACQDQNDKIDLLQRISFMIVSMATNYRAALDISERAAVLCSRTGDLNRLGRIMVDQGIFLASLECYSEAEDSFLASLKYLNQQERRNRVAAFQGIGLLSQLQGDSQEALRYAQQASKIAIGCFEVGKLQWLIGCAYSDIQSWEEAFEAFDKAFENLQRTSAIDAGLTVCDHVKALLQTGSLYEARAKSQGMRVLLEPLAQYPIASAAIRDLIRCEHEGKQLTIAFVLDVRKRIEKGRKATNADRP